MATSKQIACINKTNRTDPHERISHVGGAGWKYATSDAIKYIENGTYTFYVHVGGYQVDVIIATNNGSKYLKTKNDGVSPDNLLSLKEC